MYWKDSCRPVNVDSIDWGVVSILHIPSALHNVLHGCFILEWLLGMNVLLNQPTYSQRWSSPFLRPCKWSMLEHSRLHSWHSIGHIRLSQVCLSCTSSLVWNFEDILYMNVRDHIPGDRTCAITAIMSWLIWEWDIPEFTRLEWFRACYHWPFRITYLSTSMKSCWAHVFIIFVAGKLEKSG